jgi:hypothetical protein
VIDDSACGGIALLRRVAEQEKSAFHVAAAQRLLQLFIRWQSHRCFGLRYK